MAAVLEGGARNLCAVRCVNNAKNPAQVLKRMMDGIPAITGR